MRSMVFPLSLCLAIATASVSDAQGGVKDGSHWSGGGVDVAFDVGFTSGTNVTVQAITSSGWSGTVSGTPGDNHSAQVASCDTSKGVMTVPTADGTMQVKCENGQAKRLKNGKWIPMRRNFRLDLLGGPRSHTDGSHDEVVSLPAMGELTFEEYATLFRDFTADPTTSRASRRN